MSIVAKRSLISATAELLFQEAGRPPSWICDARVRTTHEGHLVVFITVHNLAGIDALVSVICKEVDFVGLDKTVHKKRPPKPTFWGVNRRFQA